MKTCNWEQRVERWFDDPSTDSEEVQAHVDGCRHCREQLELLRAMRAGVQAMADCPDVSDGQFPAFMAGVQDGLEPPRRRFGGLWALTSLTAAAFIVAISASVIFAPSTNNAVRAGTEVEEAVSDLDDTRVQVWSDKKSGATYVWVDDKSGDMW
jgi:anti-sigma factor RsiW